MEPATQTSTGDGDARSGGGRGRTFLRGYLVSAVPLVLLVVPLLSHHSKDGAVGSFSRLYLASVIVAFAVSLTLPAAVGWACARSGGALPAYSFVVGVAAVVGTCLVVETVLAYRLRLVDAFAQYSAWGHKRSLLFAFEAAPSHTWENAGATYTTDALGFRTHLRDAAWETRTGPRVFAVGESSVFGYGLNDDETWPHLLEGKLRERLGDPPFTVVNAGNNGHTSLQTLFRFYRRVLPHRPTHVIVYAGPNDFYGTGPDRLTISEDILFSGSVAEYWAAKTRGKNPYARTLLFYVVQQSFPFLRLGPGLGDAPDIAAAAAREAAAAMTPEMVARQQQTLMDTVGSDYVENIRTLCLISRAHHVEPVLVTFMQDMKGWVAGALRNNNMLLRRLAAAEGIQLVDVAGALEPLADKGTYFFPDRYHPSRKGAELIAATVARDWREETVPAR